MKFKWWFPFLPIAMIFISDPHMQRDLADRVAVTTGSCPLCVLLLCIIRPWKK